MTPHPSVPRRRSARARAFLLALALLLLPASARADVVVTWMDVADWALAKAWEADRTFRSAANTRAYAQVALAMFEAVNAVDRRYTPYLGDVTASPGASAEAAAAHAAHAVLAKLLPQQQKAFDDALAVSLAHVPAGPAREAGAAVGRAAAASAMHRAALPEGAALAHYRPRTAPGAYVDPGLPSILPFDVRMPPFFLKSADEIRPAGPPPLSSERYARDLDEVRRLGAKESAERTPLQTLTASSLLWIDYAALLRDVARQPGRTLAQNARLYALVAMVQEEAWLAVMDAKMHFGTWRPITAIRNADDDGNDRTTGVPDWEPLLRTPTHPDYPCGHCGTAAAVATVLEAETGPAPTGGIRLVGVEHSPGLAVTVPTWAAFVETMSMSRIYAGAHTRAANEDAEAMGREVARRALQGFLTTVAGAGAKP